MKVSYYFIDFSATLSLGWWVSVADKISHDFLSAARTYPTANHKYIAVAAILRENAEKFAIYHDIPKFYGSYLDLDQDSEIGKSKNDFWSSLLL